jgi:hypothetical protein
VNEDKYQCPACNEIDSAEYIIELQKTLIKPENLIIEFEAPFYRCNECDTEIYDGQNGDVNYLTAELKAVRDYYKLLLRKGEKSE